MIDIAVLLGADKNRSKVELQNVIQFESLIANVRNEIIFFISNVWDFLPIDFLKAPQNKNRFLSLTIRELEEIASNVSFI
jgi:hypothetical protein